MSSLVKEILFLNVKPISLNACHRSYYRQPKSGKGFVTTIKSEQYRLFEEQLKVQFALQMDKFAKIANFYKNGENFLVMSYIFKFPRNEYLTKVNKINKRGGDLDNFIKPVNDSIFKMFRRYNKDMDDASIVGLKALKMPHEMDEHKIIIEMKLMDSLEGVTIY